jgi:hypothetical protein
MAAEQTTELKTVRIWTKAAPPEWAFWERHLLEKLYPAAIEFVEKYTRPDGTLIWRDEWPGMDGSDDGYESFYNFPLYYALGGPKEMDALSRKLWEAVTRQFTAYGQIHQEFDGYYDWMHHGESYTNFYFFGLADPANTRFRERATRFAGLYLNEDPHAQNYDAVLQLIRSPINGSRGPRFVNSAEDWVTHRPILSKYPLPFDDIPNVNHSSAWDDDEKFPHILKTLNERMMRGDVPLNLTATSLVANAYMYDGDEKYKQWIKQYVTAWSERTRNNNDILPDNVGLTGKVGENMGGKWWGGYYGWRWPHGLFNQLEATIIGAGNAYLVTGSADHLELPRSVFRLVERQAKEVDGRRVVPHRHGDQGWYDYRPLNPKYPAQLWYLSRNEEDWQRVVRATEPSGLKNLSYRKGKGDSENAIAWLGFVRDENPDYPLQILKSTWGETQRRLERIRGDRSKPDEQDVHHWQRRNPVVLEGLVQLMLGSPNHIYHGGLLHASVRYFDPLRRRPGVPSDVAALVDRVSENGISVQLVNLHPSESRDLIIQGGAFGEHQISSVRQIVQYPHQFDTINGRWFRVHLVPGAVGRLEIGLKRFTNQPSHAQPWDNTSRAGDE